MDVASFQFQPIRKSLGIGTKSNIPRSCLPCRILHAWLTWRHIKMHVWWPTYEYYQSHDIKICTYIISTITLQLEYVQSNGSVLLSTHNFIYLLYHKS